MPNRVLRPHFFALRLSPVARSNAFALKHSPLAPHQKVHRRRLTTPSLLPASVSQGTTTPARKRDGRIRSRRLAGRQCRRAFGTQAALATCAFSYPEILANGETECVHPERRRAGRMAEPTRRIHRSRGVEIFNFALPNSAVTRHSVPSRFRANSFKTNDRGTTYSTQKSGGLRTPRRGLFSPKNDRPRSEFMGEGQCQQRSAVRRECWRRRGTQ
jgi:hypothetical protein